jgi:hypothetical protein
MARYKRIDKAAQHGCLTARADLLSRPPRTETVGCVGLGLDTPGYPIGPYRLLRCDGLGNTGQRFAKILDDWAL